MQQVFKVIGNFLLEWVATILIFVVFPFNFAAELIREAQKHFKVFWDIPMVVTETSKESFSNALAIDIFFNKHYETFWNMTFRKEGGYGFGEEGETLSVAMAKNMKQGTLSWFGWICAFFINVADITTWGKGGHFKGIADKPRLK